MQREGLGIDTGDDIDTAKIDAKIITPQSALDRLKRIRAGPAVSPRNVDTTSPRSAYRLNKSPRNIATPKGAEDRLKQIELQKRRTSLLRSGTPKGQKDLWAKLSSSSSEDLNLVTKVR